MGSRNVTRHIFARARPNAIPAGFGAAGLVALGVAWLWLYAPVFAYFGVIFSRSDFRLNQIMLIAIVGLMAWQVRAAWRGLPGRNAFLPHPRLIPLCVALGASVLYLLAEKYLDVNTLSATLFGIATYGLAGLWLQPATWRRIFPAAMLLIATLPFGEHLQTFLGYPMRVASAQIARDTLVALHVPVSGVEAILVLENGVANVDNPCSGVRSLWTGAVFLLAVIVIERRKFGWRWLMAGAVLFVSLFIANTARVTILALVGQAFNLRPLASMLHVPLGVIGFGLACALAWGVLRISQKPLAKTQNLSGFAPLRETKQSWFTPALALAVGVMGLAHQPKPHVGLQAAPIVWSFPKAMQTTPEPLRPDERDWLTRDGAEDAQRFRFSWGAVNGSVMLVTSSTWRAHHKPERCFEVFGLSMDESSAHWARPDFPVRVIALGARQDRPLTATYWFQSPTRATDDYGARIWADVTERHTRWVLVSVLFDRQLDPSAPNVTAFYTAMNQMVNEQLNKQELSP